MRTARPIALLMAMALVLLPACSAPWVSPAPSAPTDTRVVVMFTAPNGKGGLTEGLEALDVNTGKLLWTTQLGIISGLNQPTIENGVVYASIYRQVVAVRERDGKLLWRVPSPGSCSGGSITVDESAIAFQCGLLYVLDPATGAERWHLANPIEGYVMRHGVIYTTADLMGDASDLIPQSPRTPAPTFNFRQHPPVAKALVALNERDGSLLWQEREDVALLPGAVTDRTLYLSGLSMPLGPSIPYPNTYAFDAHSGRQLTASSHTATGTLGSTIYARGVFVAATDQFVLVYDSQSDPMHPRTWALSASDGKVLWDVPGDVLNVEDAPTIIRISGDFIYSSVVNFPGGANSGVTAVRVRDGSVAWKWGLPSKTYLGGYTITSLRVIGGSVFVMLTPSTSPGSYDPPFGDRKLTSLNAATGALNWQHNMARAGYIAVPTMEWMTTIEQGAHGRANG
jgi:outer membrane protein assembly factor BamB